MVQRFGVLGMAQQHNEVWTLFLGLHWMQGASDATESSQVFKVEPHSMLALYAIIAINK